MQMILIETCIVYGVRIHIDISNFQCNEYSFLMCLHGLIIIIAISLYQILNFSNNYYNTLHLSKALPTDDNEMHLV